MGCDACKGEVAAIIDLIAIGVEMTVSRYHRCRECGESFKDMVDAAKEEG